MTPRGAPQSCSTCWCQADDFAAKLENDLRQGSYIDPAGGKVLLRKRAEEWYAARSPALKRTTARDYRSLLDNHVLPKFGDWQLGAITEGDVEEWRDSLKGKLGPKRIGKAMQVLSLVLASAVKKKLLTVNEAAGVKGPAYQRREMAILTPAQVEALADAIDPRFRALVLVSAYGGLRPCEVVALRVKRFDQLHGTLTVAEAAPETAGRLAWGEVKTYETRVVHLPRSVADAVVPHLDGKGPADLIFTAARGGPVRESKWVRGHFKPALAAAGLPGETRWYDLRHTCASILIREGASIKAVQKHLGHKTASMTLDIYGHLYPDELPSMAARLERVRGLAAAPSVQNVSSGTSE